MTPQIKMKGSEAIVKALQDEGCDVIFGYPGGVVIPFYDALMDSDLRHLLVRHEQGAAHAADGYARATGKVGVCIATSGPGRDQPGHRHRQRLPRLDPDRRHHRPGQERPHRHRRLPGGRHDRHHAADRQALLPRAGRRRAAADHPRGVPHRRDRATGPGAHRHPGDGVPGGGRLPPSRPPRPAGLQADRPGPHQADPRRREGDQRGRAARALRRRRRHLERRGAGAVPRRRAAPPPGGHDAHGPGRLPRDARAGAGHARHARHRDGQLRRPRVRPAHRRRGALRRPRHRQAQRLRPQGQGHPHRRRPGRDRQERRAHHPDRRRRQARARRSGEGARGAGVVARAHGRLVGEAARVAGRVPAALRGPDRRHPGAPVRHPGDRPRHEELGGGRAPTSASTRCGPPSTTRTPSRASGSAPAAWARWASVCRRASAPRSGAPTPR